MLRDENLELSSHNDHLSEEVERLKKKEDKLKEELALSKRNEEGLKRELDEAKKSMTRMASSTEKLDHILGVGKSPCDKRGLRFENDKETFLSKKTVFVKGLGNKEASPVHTPRKKIDLGQCSKNAQVKVVLRKQPQANIPHHSAQKGKKPIMQVQHWKQDRPIQQRRRIEPTQPQRQGKAPMYAQGHGMIPYFIPTCHFCGFNKTKLL